MPQRVPPDTPGSCRSRLHQEVSRRRSAVSCQRGLPWDPGGLAPAASNRARLVQFLEMANKNPTSCLTSEDTNLYFILSEKCSGSWNSAEAGSLCYITEKKYLASVSQDTASSNVLEVTILDSPLKYLEVSIPVDVNVLQPLTKQQAELLFAVGASNERLNCFLDRAALDDALNAQEGQNVAVSVYEEMYSAIIRYIGQIHESTPLLKVYFGVELQGDGEGKGKNDGSYNLVRRFHCKRKCGLFLPFNKIKFLTDEKPREDSEAPKEHEAEPVKRGDTVGFYDNDGLKYGTVDSLEHSSSGRVVHVHLVDGSKDNVIPIPMDSVIKEELLSGDLSAMKAILQESTGGLYGLETDCTMDQQYLKQISVEPNSGNLEAPSSNTYFMSLNSMVQIKISKEELVSGIIRWTGYLPNMPSQMAGVELDEERGCTDGTWQGKQYFSCLPKRGIFVKLQACQPDMRFHSSQGARPKPLEANVFNGTESSMVLENQPPLSDGTAVLVLKGRMKGIQGHCNSCYMDAALFSLFSCTSVLDSMLFMPSNPADVHIQKILRAEIVNPLRRNGFVPASSVMKLRHQLTQESHCPSFATSEKDPEEFLNLIMHHILGIDPLLKLQSGGQKEQECYCYQIFMEKQEDMVVPDVQQLVAHSFISSDLKLTEIPSCFIIQMPRFGKEYKMFSKIIPSLELDITDLLFESPRECIVCGELATLECPECFKDMMFANALVKQYCDRCCKQAHSHYKRKGHKPMKLKNPSAFENMKHLHSHRIPREKMELFAVLCIETSHYVSFVKYGPEKEHWMFFDSMADRYGDDDGYNIPMVTLCPEVAKYLESPVAELAEKRPRDMEGVAKRLFCDAYMYMYQSKKMELYK
ncbi:ubiquitin carboxyl-terminal hydrolase CYLD-like [Pleurodeles waltl]|uniref:ubiquitin carboxyl-terminal hydrolase CYLD-like n=1 Tax=Pleurodeles waltl TaxID=8319 RepID=UPI0037099596